MCGSITLWKADLASVFIGPPLSGSGSNVSFFMRRIKSRRVLFWCTPWLPICANWSSSVGMAASLVICRVSSTASAAILCKSWGDRWLQDHCAFKCFAKFDSRFGGAAAAAEAASLCLWPPLLFLAQGKHFHQKPLLLASHKMFGEEMCLNQCIGYVDCIPATCSLTKSARNKTIARLQRLSMPAQTKAWETGSRQWSISYINSHH